MAKRLYNQYGEGVPTPASSSLTAAECPTIQFDSDTIVWEAESDPTEEGLSFIRRTLSTPTPRLLFCTIPLGCQWQLWIVTCASDRLATDPRFNEVILPLGVNLFAGVALRPENISLTRYGRDP